MFDFLKGIATACGLFYAYKHRKEIKEACEKATGYTLIKTDELPAHLTKKEG